VEKEGMYFYLILAGKQIVITALPAKLPFSVLFFVPAIPLPHDVFTLHRVTGNL